MIIAHGKDKGPLRSSGLLTAVLMVVVWSGRAEAQSSASLALRLVPELKITGDPGSTNRVEWSDQLGPDANWQSLTNIVLGGNTAVMLDLAPGSVTRYYRVVTLVDTNTVVAPPGMVFMPTGSFNMGDSYEEGYPDELPVHQVSVSAYFMDKFDVSLAHWNAVHGWARAHGYSFDNAGFAKGANHPVVRVNWFDAVKWCNARSEMEGLTPAYYTNAEHTAVFRSGQAALQNDWVAWHAGYRLPTEAEWERGARGGLAGRRFPWGNYITQFDANYMADPSYDFDLNISAGYHPTYQTGAQPFTSPVDAFAPNGLGFHDMAGNVYQWCWDWYDDYPPDAVVDPRGPLQASARILRGGGWALDAYEARCSYRGVNFPGAAVFTTGFRAVRSAAGF